MTSEFDRLAVTIFKTLGIDPGTAFHSNGRPIKIADNGKYLSELFY